MHNASAVVDVLTEYRTRPRQADRLRLITKLEDDHTVYIGTPLRVSSNTLLLVVTLVIVTRADCFW